MRSSSHTWVCVNCNQCDISYSAAAAAASVAMDARRMRPKQKPKIPPMDQRIKPTPKYENVRPTINTGNNLRKQMEK